MKTNKFKLDNIFQYSTYIVLALIFIVFTIGSDKFLTHKNVYTTMFNGGPLILITCAVTFSLLVGVIDLSVGAMGYASGCLAGILIKNYDAPIVLAFLAGIALATFIGWINSVFIVKLKMNAMLVSMGMMLIIRAIAKIITHDKTISLFSLSFLRQAKIKALGGFPILLLVVFFIVLVCNIVLKQTPFGRKLLAVGSNETVAKNVGINTDRIKSAALIICGAICGIAGCFWVITLGSVVVTGLVSYEFLAIAAAVLGGTSLLGGRGSFYPGSFIGALILLFIASGMAIMGISPYAIPFVRGVIIFIAMYVDSLRHKAMMLA
ncbi:MAG: ABC transporter permease [Spirochaetales bacterium]|nr:ABC transporter permease [Spirochaetales bacterium]